MVSPQVKQKFAVHCCTCDREIGQITILPGDRVAYDELNGLNSARKRSDGHWGFECSICRTYSLAAPEEVPDILKRSRVNTPTRVMLTAVGKGKSEVTNTKEGLTCVDGFIMKELG